MKRLNILWTTNNKDTINNMIGMYSQNSLKKGWWDSVNILIWGASTKLINEDKEIQELIKQMIKSGVHLQACKACADKYNAEETLKSIGIDVKYAGQDLTDYIMNDDKLITL